MHLTRATGGRRLASTAASTMATATAAQGFGGGRWNGGNFSYNTAVMRVNTTVIRNTYVDRTVITNVNVNRVSYNGGQGGINCAAKPGSSLRRSTRSASDPRTHRCSSNAWPSQDKANFASVNHGTPVHAALAKPAASAADFNHAVPAHGAKPVNANETRPVATAKPATRPVVESHPVPKPADKPDPLPRVRYRKTSRQHDPRQSRQPRRPTAESRPAPKPVNETKPAPTPRPTAAVRPESKPAPIQHAAKPAQQPRPETRPTPESRPAQATQRPEPAVKTISAGETCSDRG